MGTPIGEEGTAPNIELRSGGSCSIFTPELQAASTRGVRWGARILNLTWGLDTQSALGGMDRFYDEIVLNHALFTRHGVEVAGAVVNKVDHHAHPSLAKVLEKGLAQHGIELLGVLPYQPLLSNPTLSMLQEQMQGELLHPGPDLALVIEHVAIGVGCRELLERVGRAAC